MCILSSGRPVYNEAFHCCNDREVAGTCQGRMTLPRYGGNNGTSDDLIKTGGVTIESEHEVGRLDNIRCRSYDDLVCVDCPGLSQK